MSTETTVERHYTHGSLEAAIREALGAAGKDLTKLAPADLAPVDEFHIGGRQATKHFAETLGVTPGLTLLDIGCGIGGASRFFASEYGATVTGVDLTEEYIAVAEAMSGWVGLADRVSYRQASGLELPFPDGAFDIACLLHVGMNIADKTRLFAEAARVVKPGGRFGVFDVMRIGEGPLAFPVPWAADEVTSFLASPADYRGAMEAAGLSVLAENARRDFALAFFNEVRARVGQDGPPPLGLHILMGEDAALKFANMTRNIEDGLIAPVEMVGEKKG